MGNKISHSGTVESVEEGLVRVRIAQTAACHQCVAANHCSASESKEKIVDVYGADGNWHEGQPVRVVASAGTGTTAVVLGFGVPFVLLVLVVWLLMHLTGNEPASAMGGIAGLVVYYLVLSLFRSRLRERFSFSIEAVDEADGQ